MLRLTCDYLCEFGFSSILYKFLTNKECRNTTQFISLSPDLNPENPFKAIQKIISKNQEPYINCCILWKVLNKGRIVGEDSAGFWLSMWGSWLKVFRILKLGFAPLNCEVWISFVALYKRSQGQATTKLVGLKGAMPLDKIFLFIEWRGCPYSNFNPLTSLGLIRKSEKNIVYCCNWEEK